MIRHCPDCAEAYDPRYSTHDCDDDLYHIASSAAGVPDRHVLVETHDEVGDREYADVLTTLDCRDPVADALLDAGYEFDSDVLTGCRVRFRVYRDA